MSIPREADPATLFLSILSADWEFFWPGLQTTLENTYGPCEFCSEPFAFEHTHYYDEELGSPISRRVLAFERLIPQDQLAQVKLYTNSLETTYARENGTRRLNLDPGLLNLERLVLATGKNFTHRIYLGQGIWGDLTLIFQNGGWKSMPWTFADYATEEMQVMLTDMRGRYKQKITALNT